MGFPDNSDAKEFVFSSEDPSSIPGSGRSPREWNSYSLQYSCLENSVDRVARRSTLHGLLRTVHD